MRLLLTNDDGVHADGLFALRREFSRGHDVTVVAPERQRSGAGHGITLHKPLRMTPTQLRDGSPAFESNGTPADCATLGILEAMGDEVDLVVSGINRGPNLGWDVHYSGTVAAAFEAALLGKPSMAISVVSWDPNIHWDTAAAFAVKLAEWMNDHPLPPYIVLNVNVPNLPQSEIRGVAMVSMGKQQYMDRIARRFDPDGRPYFWLGGGPLSEEPSDTEPGTDTRAVVDHMITVTPLKLDMTDYDTLQQLKEMRL